MPLFFFTAIQFLKNDGLPLAPTGLRSVDSMPERHRKNQPLGVSPRLCGVFWPPNRGLIRRGGAADSINRPHASRGETGSPLQWRRPHRRRDLFQNVRLCPRGLRHNALSRPSRPDEWLSPVYLDERGAGGVCQSPLGSLRRRYGFPPCAAVGLSPAGGLIKQDMSGRLPSHLQTDPGATRTGPGLLVRLRSLHATHAPIWIRLD